MIPGSAGLYTDQLLEKNPQALDREPAGLVPLNGIENEGLIKKDKVGVQLYDIIFFLFIKSGIEAGV